ncbi:MAG: glycosyltransferase [Cytophagales bacterium]|nr:glycosyltransferase [Cytophagales bacterium]
MESHKTPQNMAAIKIFLFTYKRNHLLPRSVQSIISQHFTDWVCELHNDHPADTFPAQYIDTLHDSRFTVVNHATNLGGVATFNIPFEQNFAEPYFTILEDDNWWEPDFLHTMMHHMASHHQVNYSWANMYLWQEEQGNNWQNTLKTTWPANTAEVTLFHFGHPKQFMSHLHSNGAMLMRNTPHKSRLITPTHHRQDFMEHYRERHMTYPIMLVHKPLANFAITLSSYRKVDVKSYNAHIYNNMITFAELINIDHQKAQNILQYYDNNTNLRYRHHIIHAAMHHTQCRIFLQFMTLSDYFYYIAWIIKSSLSSIKNNIAQTKNNAYILN